MPNGMHQGGGGAIPDASLVNSKKIKHPSADPEKKAFWFGKWKSNSVLAT
jgi:hypothetical protein